MIDSKTVPSCRGRRYMRQAQLSGGEKYAKTWVNQSRRARAGIVMSAAALLVLKGLQYC